MRLLVEKREALGKQLKKYRAAGRLPVVLYGAGISAPVSLFVDAREFRKIWREAGESSVVEITDGRALLASALIQDVQTDPLRDEPVHADLVAVDMKKPIEAAVPIVFTGESPIVKSQTAVLVKVMHEVEVSALPKDLPHEIAVPLSSLTEIGGHITVGDLTLPAGVTIKASPNDIIVLVKAQEEEKAEEVAVDFDKIGDAEERGKKEAEAHGTEENAS